MNAYAKDMSLWYVYNEDGKHVGPVTTDLLARGIAAGKVPPQAHVGAVGAASWVPALEVPEVLTAVQKARSSAPPPPPALDATLVMPSLSLAGLNGPMPKSVVKSEQKSEAPPADAPPAGTLKGERAGAAAAARFALLPAGILGASALISSAIFVASVFLRR